MSKDIDRFLKEMEYRDSYGKSEVLALGIYRGFQYAVLNVRGSYPCGYVNISGFERKLSNGSMYRYENDCGGSVHNDIYGMICCHRYKTKWWPDTERKIAEGANDEDRTR